MSGTVLAQRSFQDRLMALGRVLGEHSGVCIAGVASVIS